MNVQFWLAMVNQHGSARLVDGPHPSIQGANKAAALHVRLGLNDSKCMRVAEVILHDPSDDHSPLNDGAIAALNLAKAGAV